MTETDVLNSLEEAIEEFHKLREESSRLLERARWPAGKSPHQEAPSPDLTPVPEVLVP